MAKTRTHALDNFRAALTALVILHHASIPYGGSGTWLYKAHLYAENSSPTIILFNVINQTFFMAAFFLLSAYFSSISARRRTRRVFLWEKWKRLGIAVVVYSVLAKGIIRGISSWILHNASFSTIFTEFLNGVKSTRGVNGPVWYCALLLVLDICYTILLPSHFLSSSSSTTRKSQPTSSTPLLPPPSQPTKSPPSKKPQPFRTSYVLVALVLTSVLSFFTRLTWPTGRALWPLSLQLAYTPQYILYYTTGIYIHRSGRNLHTSISPSTLRVLCVIVAILHMIAAPYLAHLLNTGTPLTGLFPLAKGGWNVLAVIYAFYNEFVGLLLCALLLRAFHNQRFSGLQARWVVVGVELPAWSFAAFLIHPLVLVGLACGFGRLGAEDVLGAVGMAVVTGILGVVGSWGLGGGVKICVEGLGVRGVL